MNTSPNGRELFGGDLFGQPVIEKPKEEAKGYAAPPGTGPEGETCKTCAHLCRIRYAGTYYKCALMRHLWKHSKKTDVLVKSPACAKWEKEKPKL